jgi:predicted nuclease with RNAse H fold
MTNAGQKRQTVFVLQVKDDESIDVKVLMQRMLLAIDAPLNRRARALISLFKRVGV